MIQPPNWHFERVLVRLGARQSRLELRRDEVRKFAADFYTVAPGIALSGVRCVMGDAR